MGSQYGSVSVVQNLSQDYMGVNQNWITSLNGHRYHQLDASFWAQLLTGS